MENRRLFRFVGRWLTGAVVGLGFIWLATHEQGRAPFTGASEGTRADDWPQESQVELPADLVATARAEGGAAA